LRQRIIELRATHDRVIDEVNVDTLIDAHGVVDTGRAHSIVESWHAYLDEHRNEITVIQLLQESNERRMAFADVQQLADRIARPPHNWTPDLIWQAYEVVDVGRVRHSDHHTLTDLVSLLRYTVGADEELVPYVERVRERYAVWLTQQAQSGTEFSELERWWLDRMVEVIAASAGISAHDLDEAPFTERGGVDGALRDLGDRAANLVDQLNIELTA
jgi:type I restriction enzyme R subunit